MKASSSPLPTGPRALIDASSLSKFQWQTFVLCFFVTLFDGFDTQAIAYTGPAIASAFHLGPSELTPLIVAGTVGMALGAISLGSLGDRIGRRLTILLAVLVFGIFSVATGFAHSPAEIFLARFFTGLGMGGAVPAVLSLVSEFAPARHRGLVITGVLLGLPTGAIGGGLLGARLLSHIGWQGIFMVGGILPLVYLLILYAHLPESPSFLAVQDLPRHRQKIAVLLGKIMPALDKATLRAASFIAPEKTVRASFRTLINSRFLRNTLAVWMTYFCNWAAWFMLLLWLPTVLKTAGLPPEQAALGTVIVNSPAIFFCLFMAYYLPKKPVRLLLTTTLAFGIAVAFGLGLAGNLAENIHWALVFFLIGAAGVGIGLPQIALNYVVIEAYPTELRATGAGWAIGMGRTGSIVGAALGGWCLKVGGVAGFYYALTVPLLLALLGVLMIRTQKIAAT
ncbi:MFS transporter [Rugosibacter aromaticivorans]|uniref:MFS transporter n=1 Tax=Rugosibacter aromaticivorans TaxID=1565605 RepID=UPI000A976977|nr:MFS transporter [Rugosibacter aromaticivorans]